MQMIIFYGLADGASLHALNLTSTACVLYSQANDSISLGGTCLGLSTNNIVEYHVLIGLLTEAASHDIDHLVVFMDS